MIMDSFTERIIAKKKTSMDKLYTGGLIFCGGLITLIMFAIPVLSTFAPFLFAGLVFGEYYLIKARNIEFEYTYTNGEIDIDVIIGRRKRKRVYSGDCKEFDIVAKYGSDKYDEYIRGVQKTIVSVSSLNSQEVYFIAASNKGQRLVILFEPGMKMLNMMQGYIPKKVFID
jgi:hypothetical protein